jgi:hypothetical protein
MPYFSFEGASPLEDCLIGNGTIVLDGALEAPAT